MYDHTMLSWHAKIARHTTIDHKYPWHRKRSTQKQQKQKIPRRHKIWSSVEREIARKQKHHTCCGWNGHGATVAVITNIIISFKYFCTSRRFNVSMAVAGGQNAINISSSNSRKSRNYFHCLHSQWSAFSSDFLCFFSSLYTHTRTAACVHRVSVCVCSVFTYQVSNVSHISIIQLGAAHHIFLVPTDLWKVIFWSVSIQTAPMDAHSKIAEI